MSDICRVIQGDCREVLKTLPDESVQCCVTSPPYFQLRDYHVDGQLGLEKTPSDFIREMVKVFTEVRRVMKKDATLWVNMGDSYASAWGCSRRSTVGNGSCPLTERVNRLTGTLKEKDMVGMPWMLAFALRDEVGLHLRCDVIWHKPNPMPESVTDRPTKSHEYLFLFSKQEKYFYDAEAILEPCSPNTNLRVSQNVAAQIGSTRANGGAKTNGNMKAVVRGGVNPKAKENATGSRQNESFSAAVAGPVTNRNKRSVWTVPTKGFSGAHFATYPPELITPCILAGTRPGDVVLDPFAGSGTTGEVALELGRRFLGIELNPEYIKLIEQRTRQTGFPL
ncbi:MAG TPA: site-specific DNA-methyltransferase [Methylomirabilota bacterium]|nr:site-specific DNA-methyltransferase [Methylomirabilota bacterium]